MLSWIRLTILEPGQRLLEPQAMVLGPLGQRGLFSTIFYTPLVPAGVSGTVTLPGLQSLLETSRYLYTFSANHP